MWEGPSRHAPRAPRTGSAVPRSRRAVQTRRERRSAGGVQSDVGERRYRQGIWSHSALSAGPRTARAPAP
eukprot:8967685-Alexandrium_andersonii.AAC.1